ncbi:M23 family metallopeptidase [Acidocella sp.]|uniref:M23 family metallopeptidase n=1 Tax=Acidocella sp. TaxID=50710 RepID=UPI002F415B5D
MTPVTMQILQADLIPVPGTDGFIHLAYAAQLTNLDRGVAELETIAPVDPLHDFAAVGSSGVMDADGNNISGTVRPFNPARPGDDAARTVDARQLQGGASGIAFFDVRFTKMKDVPGFLSHRLVVRLPGGKEVNELINPVPVGCQSPVVISPPLIGPRWWDANGCCEVISPHRGATLPINGTIKLPEQFAIDYVQINAKDGCCTGPTKDLKSWPFFGAPVLAVADGLVVEKVDGMPEQVPGEVKGINVQNAGGNHIIEAIGNGRYVLYAHLRTGSIPAGIVVGTALKRGEKIGEIGNTGSSTAPHLHFQVMDSPSVLDATGLPFVFDRQLLEGQVGGTANEADHAYESGASIDVSMRSAKSPQSNLMPIEGQVFTYNEK